MNNKSLTFLILSTALAATQIEPLHASSLNIDENPSLVDETERSAPAVVSFAGDTIEINFKPTPKKKKKPANANMLLADLLQKVKAEERQFKDIEKSLLALKEKNNSLPADFDAVAELESISAHLRALQEVISSEGAFADKNSALLNFAAKSKELNARIKAAQKYMMKASQKTSRRQLTKSDENRLKLMTVGQEEKKNETREVKQQALALIKQQKKLEHHKLTRPGAQGPNARDRDLAAERHRKQKEEKGSRPFRKVEFRKEFDGQIPHAAMDTVVDIRNIIRKCKDRNHVVEELQKFEKDLDFKMLDDNSYVNMPKHFIVYQAKINDRFRVIIPFAPMAFEDSSGKQIVMDLLVENTFIVDDPHNK